MLLKEERWQNIFARITAQKKQRKHGKKICASAGRGEGTMLANMKPLEKQWLPPNVVGLRASFDGTTRDKFSQKLSAEI